MKEDPCRSMLEDPQRWDRLDRKYELVPGTGVEAG